MRLSRFSVGCMASALLLSVSLLARTVGAQPAAPNASADQLFEDGRKAMMQGQFEAAARLLEASQKADPAAGTLLNLAECYEKLDKIASSIETYTLARDEAKRAKRDKWADQASQRIAALTPRLPKVRILGTPPPGARFELDGKVLAVTPGVPIPIDPLTHRLVVLDGTRELQSKTFSAKEGLTTDIAFEFTEAPPGPSLLPAKPDLAQPSPAKDTTRGAASSGPSPLVWVLGGAALASAAAGTVLLVVRNGQVASATEELELQGCPQKIPQSEVDRCNSLRSQLSVSMAPQAIAFAASGAFAISAVALFLATKNDTPRGSARALCAPALGGGTCIVHF
ncbi:MAG: hypothetical protein U0174_24970 [Polyangiaceae bacterium]